MIHIIPGKIVKIVLYVYIESFCAQYEYAMLNFSFHFPPSTLVSSTNKTERHYSTKALLKVALITITHKFPLFYMLGKGKSYKCAAKCLIIFQFYFGCQCYHDCGDASAEGMMRQLDIASNRTDMVY
jgi:hypothetical protein